MAKRAAANGGPAVPVTTVRDPKTGEMLVLRGYGALKGQFVVREGIDLTKPIAEQVAELERRERERNDANGTDVVRPAT